MAADTFVVEVGEKTAMRRRLLNAWQFIRVLQANRTYQNFYRHLLNGLIMLFTFGSVLTGVMSYEVKGTVDKGLNTPPPSSAAVLLRPCSLDNILEPPPDLIRGRVARIFSARSQLPQ